MRVETRHSHEFSWLLTPAISARATKSQNQQLRKTLPRVESGLLQIIGSGSATHDRKILEGILNVQQ
jgi:hypothetical protein